MVWNRKCMNVTGLEVSGQEAYILSKVKVAKSVEPMTCM